MAGIRSVNTKPELIVRSGLHALGFRFRLHDRRLPGKPDLFLPKYRAAIFVHGCFWHGHNCRLFKLPETRRELWRDKIDGNRKRDSRVREELCAAGIRCLVVWECALRGRAARGSVIAEAAAWLRSDAKTGEIGGLPDDGPGGLD